MSEQATSDIQRITVGQKEIILVGTAHISQASVDTVLSTIEEEAPDTVCVELDQQRYDALKNKNRWESLNLIQVIRQGQAPFLLANLALAAFQKRMGLSTGVKPGAELAAAADAAQERGIQVELVDRNIRTTLLRAWRKTGFWKKMQLVSTLVASMFESHELDEAELARLRQSDTLSAMLEEMGQMLPSVKTILVDERDLYMAHHIRNAPGEKIVAVVGAAHLPGILRLITEPTDPRTIAEISTVPPKSVASKIVPWIVPAVVIALFIIGFFMGDRDRIAGAAMAWILANGLLAALGTIVAFGHPLTVVAAFVGAPITSLNPTIGAGFVTGLVQAFIAAPTVRDMENMGEDMANLRGWWKNRMTRVLLVFMFSSLGSAIGTIVAFRWLKDLL
ncbi:conjugal transfer protein TraB [Desulfuromonas versatilis]|uniref:Conjugal transfer protein TraB n=1 Tax=Desulfuromonas versatilis TaxID=2802975 RepID=A0ABM8HRN8_9BACT|nr:TraB/GumN family protein [Desulfuromonas versatilis]BCR04574.1 conjugal transfer protein TraB [Desulfuromonas versatilis]